MKKMAYFPKLISHQPPPHSETQLLNPACKTFHDLTFLKWRNSAAFLCVGRCKSLGWVKSFLWYAPQLSGPISCVFSSWVSSGLTMGSGCSLMIAGWQVFFVSFPETAACTGQRSQCCLCRVLQGQSASVHGSPRDSAAPSSPSTGALRGPGCHCRGEGKGVFLLLPLAGLCISLPHCDVSQWHGSNLGELKLNLQPQSLN